MTTPNLLLPELIANQSQPHVPLNAALRRLDAITQCTCIAQLNDPPVGSPSPADGERYLVGPVPTGDWVGHENAVAVYVGTGWQFFTPEAGWLVFLQGNSPPSLMIYGTGSPVGWDELVTGGGAASAASAALVRRTTDQAVTSGAWATVSWDTEDLDTDGYWSSGDPTKFIAPANGVYEFSFNCRMDSVSTAARGLSIVKNGNRVSPVGTTVAESYVSGSNYPGNSISGMVALTAGDYVKACAYSGATENLYSAGIISFSVKRIS